MFSASGWVHQGLSASGSMSLTLERYRDRAIVMKRLSLWRMSTTAVWAGAAARSAGSLALPCGDPASDCAAASGSGGSSEQAAAAASMTAARSGSTVAARFALMAVASLWMESRSAADVSYGVSSARGCFASKTDAVFGVGACWVLCITDLAGSQMGGAGVVSELSWERGDGFPPSRE